MTQFKVMIQMIMVTKHIAPAKPQLAVTQNAININHDGNNNPANDITISRGGSTHEHTQIYAYYIQFVQTLVRLTILFSISFIGSLITPIVFFALSICGTHNDNDQAMWKAFGIFMFQLDCFINIACIVLQFPSMDAVTCNIYNKCCGVCDKRCNETYQKKMTHKKKSKIPKVQAGLQVQ